MTKKVRVGIIGTSWWAETMFLPSLGSHPAAEIVAICGRNRERGEELAKKHGIAEVYTDYRNLIKEATIDAIVIAAPDDLHYPMTMAALEAGLHVLCEKPMALTVEHAKQMTEKAKAVGVKHMVLFTWRWLPIFQYTKQLIDDGYVGRCYQASFRFLTGFGRNSNYTWRSDGDRSNGVFSDLGAHMVDFAHWLVGDVQRVNAHLKTFVERPPEDEKSYKSAHDAAFVLLEFADQGQGMIQVSTMSHKGKQLFELTAEIYGEAGSLEINYTISNAGGVGTIRGARQDEEEFRPIEIPEHFFDNLDPADPFAQFLKQSAGPRLFIDSILEDKQPSPNFNDGLNVQEVIGATLKSHESGGWVSIGKD
jgi:predicted dehydrogenase